MAVTVTNQTRQRIAWLEEKLKTDLDIEESLQAPYLCLVRPRDRAVKLFTAEGWVFPHALGHDADEAVLKFFNELLSLRAVIVERRA